MMWLRTKAGMKSGSLRAMPLPPKLSTACGTFRSTKMRRPAASMRTGATEEILPLAGSAPNTLSSSGPSVARIDIADHADLQFVAREYAADIGLEIVARNQRNRFERAVERTSIGMIRKRRAPPQTVADIVRVRGFAPQRRQHLLAIAFDRVGIEARRVEREPQQLEAFVHLVAQDAKRTAEFVALHAKAEFDGGAVHALLKGARIEIAGAFVEQSAPSNGRRRAFPPGPDWRRPASRNPSRSAAPRLRAPARPRSRPG